MLETFFQPALVYKGVEPAHVARETGQKASTFERGGVLDNESVLGRRLQRRRLQISVFVGVYFNGMRLRFPSVYLICFP